MQLSFDIPSFHVNKTMIFLYFLSGMWSPSFKKMDFIDMVEVSTCLDL